MAATSGKGGGCMKTFYVNRFVLFVILCCYCLLAGPAYFNFTPLADTLLHHGAFINRCTDEERANPPAESYMPVCKAQEMAISSLFNIATSSHFFCSFLGGVFLDHLGPKIAGMLGVGAMLLGWVLLGLSSQTFAAYSFAAFLIGASVDTAFFPCFSVANLFPTKKSTIIAFFGCFRSLSFVVPLTIRAAVVDTKAATAPQALYVYAGAFLSLCFITATLLLPSRPFESPDEETGSQVEMKNAKLQQQNSVGLTGSDPNLATTTELGVGGSTKKSLYERLQLKSLFAEFCSASYLPLIPMYCFLLTNIIFYVPSTMHLLPRAYKANQVIQTLSFLPCPVLGYLADTFGILPVMHFTNLCGLLAYVSAIVPSIPPSVPLQFLSPILFAIQVCFLMSQLYCYLGETVSQNHLGTLVGFVCAVGGLFSLVTNPMRSYALEHGFLSMCILCIALALANACMLIFLHILKRRKASKAAAHKQTGQQEAVFFRVQLQTQGKPSDPGVQEAAIVVTETANASPVACLPQQLQQPRGLQPVSRLSLGLAGCFAL
ncbi:hypothetical protein Efla_005154 [Eimeria flavescens]